MGRRARRRGRHPFIADWIDDGCPAGDRLTNFDVEREAGDRGSPRRSSTSPSSRSATGRAMPRLPRGRAAPAPNLDCLSEPEVDRLRDAFRQIYDLDDAPEDRRNYNNRR